MQRENLHVLPGDAQQRIGLSQQLQIVLRRARFAPVRHDAHAVFRDHRQRALRQVAEVVGQIRVDPLHDRLVRVIAVLSEGDLAQEEIADLVDAVGRDQARGIDDVADRFRHLLAAVEQESVHDDLPRQFDPRRHQKGRPIDGMEARDVLADHVRVRGPEFPARSLVREPGRGDVIGERVDPDIHDVPRDRRAPARPSRTSCG